MGCIQLNEKLVARLKTLTSFEMKAVGFCEHAAHVIVVKFFINFTLEENRMTVKLARDEFNEIQNLLAKHLTYPTLDKCINAVVVILPI